MATPRDREHLPAADTLPRYIIYYNSDASPLSALVETPYTHVILSFLTATVDQNQRLQLHTPDELSPYWGFVPTLQSRGKKVMISFGGGEFQTADYAPLVGREIELAERIAGFVRQRGLDGVDIDYEASATFHTQRAPNVFDGRSFVIALNRALRDHLPSPRYLISHAPQPPYLDREWHQGPYLDILKASGEAIDWIAVQYYDNPGFDLPTSSRVVGEPNQPFATSILGLSTSGSALAWPVAKLVVGKPVYKADAASGHISPDDVLSQIITPLQQRYGEQFGGLMGWQFSTHTDDHRAWNGQVGETLLSPGKEGTAPTAASRK